MSVLVDSDILIEVSQGRDRSIVSRWIDLGRQDSLILYSPVSAAELWAGAQPREHGAIEELFLSLSCVPIDDLMGRQAGDYIRHYGKNHAVELRDALIAAAAVLSRAALWTRNRKHYPMKELTFF
jgi:predicted nucleic acid-binding protein